MVMVGRLPGAAPGARGSVIPTHVDSRRSTLGIN
jgi:hypothetical protein